MYRGTVDVRDILRFQAAYLGGDHRAGVVAGRTVPFIAEAVHQLGPGSGGALCAPAPVPERGREPETRQRRDHQVERRRWVLAVGPWIGQRADHFEELDHRARPAMAQDQRQRVALWRLDVQEVDVLAVDP